MKTSRSTLGWILIGAGFAVIGAGWGGVQSTPVVAVQLAYLASGGFVGIALVIVGVSQLSFDDVRASRQMLAELRDRFDDLEHDLELVKETLDPSRVTKPRRRAS